MNENETNTTMAKSTEANENNTLSVIKANPARKKVTAGRRRAPNRIPDEILNDKNLAADIAVLPSNYNFEVSRQISLTLHGCWYVSK